MKLLQIFGRVHKYEYDFDIRQDMDVLEELMRKITEPQILSYCGFETVDIYISGDHNFICNDCIKWIYETNKERISETDIRECLRKSAIEDEEWTKAKNENLTDIFYRKITFLPEVQGAVIEQLAEYKSQLEKMLCELKEEKEQEKAEIERQKREWEIVKTYKKVMPTGGETGRDGYIDAEYRSQKGETLRMVNRDVFDFGTYSYPKRLEGTDDIFNRTSWTAAEIELSRWIAKFGKFKGIRM